MLSVEEIADKIEESIVLSLRDGNSFPSKLVIEDKDFDEILESISAEKEDAVFITTEVLGRSVEIWRKSWSVI